MVTWLRALSRIVAMMLLAVSATNVYSQGGSFPTKPVRMLTPYPPGLAPDVVVRLVAAGLEKAWAQPVIVDPKPGGNGQIAIDAFKSAAGDEHVLIVLGNANLTINPVLIPNLRYDAEKDFVPVALLTRFNFFVMVSAAQPYRNVHDLVEYARTRPGAVSYSSSFVGSPNHLGGARLAFLTGTDMLAVHFKNSAQMIAAVVNGDITFAVSAIGTAEGMIKAGKLRLLATATRNRNPSYPAVPTIVEAGGPKDFEVDSWIGVFGSPAGPLSVYRQVASDIAKVMAQPEVGQRVRSLGGEIASESGDGIRALIERATRANAEVIRRMGIKPE